MVDVGRWLALRFGDARVNREKPPPFPEAQELKEFNEETLDFLLGELKTRIAMVDEISVHLESKTLTLLGFVSGVMLLLARFAPDVASYRLLEGSVMYGVSVLFGLCELSLSVAVLFLFGVITPRQNAWPQLSSLVEKSALVEESRILKPSILWSLVDVLAMAKTVNTAKVRMFRYAMMSTLVSVAFLVMAGLLMIL